MVLWWWWWWQWWLSSPSYLPNIIIILIIVNIASGARAVGRGGGEWGSCIIRAYSAFSLHCFLLLQYKCANAISNTNTDTDTDANTEIDQEIQIQCSFIIRAYSAFSLFTAEPRLCKCNIKCKYRYRHLIKITDTGKMQMHDYLLFTSVHHLWCARCTP